MNIPDVITPEREFTAFNTVNPPGNEATAARFAGYLSAENGFTAEYMPYVNINLNIIKQGRSCHD